MFINEGPYAIAIETENGWEPAFFDEHTGEYTVEPGFARPTEAEVMRNLGTSNDSNVIYQAGYAYACGYYD